MKKLMKKPSAWRNWWRSHQQPGRRWTRALRASRGHLDMASILQRGQRHVERGKNCNMMQICMACAIRMPWVALGYPYHGKFCSTSCLSFFSCFFVSHSNISHREATLWGKHCFCFIRSNILYRQATLSGNHCFFVSHSSIFDTGFHKYTIPFFCKK